MNTTEILTDAMRRMQAGEKLTYTDKEVELIMLGWQSELDKANAARIEAQTENEALKAKMAKSGLDKWRAVREAVAKERESLLETLGEADVLVVNFMRVAGIDKHAARKCADVVRELVSNHADGDRARGTA